MECSDFLFSMKLDFYYAVEEQDRFGRQVKTWEYDQTLDGYAEVLGAVERDVLKVDKFFQYKDKLIGRTKKDPRIDSNGFYHALTSILITDIRDANTSQEYFIESAGDRSGLSTLFEVFAIEPYINPWNEIEYYKIMFNRSETQVLLDDIITS